jgi:EamA domain-containing membrane protein RarD
MTPSIQLALGVFVLHEPLPRWRLAGFAIVWIALALLMIDGLRARRTALRAHP